ncbi:MAG: TaqI-like C-terminal specificity domain-containing protein [Candidatus Micrarchaeota archaeon]
MNENLINQLANKYGKVKPKEAIDSLIFEDLMRWRKALEKGIKEHERLNRLPTDSVAAEAYIDEAVQKILDRIIFVRVCEDRGLEEEELLRWCVRQWKNDKKIPLMNWLSRLFSKKNGEYNSGIFAPHYSENLTIENGTLESIIEESYVNPNGLTYDFSAIDADILGTIYENYLAYIQKRVWDKESKQKSKRKAHGIYYTPTYIVDYIVKNTLGERLKKCSKPEEALKIKMLDPACGSGSFLIRSYDEFRNWYTSHMKKNGEKQHTLNHELKGTTEFMDKVLENCIYGVDLDPKAVEIAQLNLLLKSAEGKHKLPTLNHTVQCGNSLIDDSIVAGEVAFKWGEKFPEVFRNGGFDVVVGNPPYVQLSMEAEVPPSLKNYLITRFESSMGRLNTFGFFIKLGIDLLNENGNEGFIIPNTLLTQDYYEELRTEILNKSKIKSIVNFQNLPFKDAVVENIILVIEKSTVEKNRNTNETIIYDLDSRLNFIKNKTIYQQRFSINRKSTFNIYEDEKSTSIREKVERDALPLGSFLEVNQAIALRHDRANWVTKNKFEKNTKPLLVGGKNIGRYSIRWDGDYLKYDINAIHSCKSESIFLTKEKIIFRRVADRLIATLDTEQYYGLHTLVIMNLKPDVDVNIRYFLAHFNSKLLTYYYRNVFASTKTVFSEIGARQVAQLPIKIVVPEKQCQLVKLVDELLSLNRHFRDISDQNSNEAQTLKTQIVKTDGEIDRLIYELYGLTEEEIKIVEEAVK